MFDEQPSVISKIADSKTSEWTQSKWWGAAASLAGVVVWTVVGNFASRVFAEAAGLMTMVVIFAGWASWSELRRPRNWIFVATVVAVHAAALYTVPWPPHHQPNKGDILFALGDCVVVFVFARQLARFTGIQGGKG